MAVSTDTERATTSRVEQLDDRDVRALTEYLVVLPDVGRARGAPGLYVVYSQDGRHRYLVDIDTGACECDDSFYRDPRNGCKHVRRARYEFGERAIPAWVDRSKIDPALLQPRATAENEHSTETTARALSDR